MFLKTSSSIAPLGYRTTGWEWREKMKADDRVDIFDTLGNWFLGTILKTQEKADSIKYAYVAFRIFFPGGSKRDKSGLLHEGWSEDYDVWMPINSIKLQK